jgi:hypothetical protein
VTKAEKPIDCFFHNRNFMESIMRLFNGNGLVSASIDCKFMSVNWCFYAVFVKHVPEFYYKFCCSELELIGGILGYDEVTSKFL